MTSPCGLDHVQAYRQHRGRLPSIRRLDSATRSCAAWQTALARQQAAPGSTLLGALEAHGLVSRAWAFHMADLGAGA